MASRALALPIAALLQLCRPVVTAAGLDLKQQPLPKDVWQGQGQGQCKQTTCTGLPDSGECGLGCTCYQGLYCGPSSAASAVDIRDVETIVSSADGDSACHPTDSHVERRLLRDRRKVADWGGLGSGFDFPRGALSARWREAFLEDDNGGWLEQWLASLQIPIPDTTCDFPLHTTMSVTNGVLHNISIAGIETQSATDHLTIVAKGLHANLSAHISLHRFPISYEGEIEVTLYNTSIGGPVQFISEPANPPYYPRLLKGLRAHDCVASIDVRIKTTPHSIILDGLSDVVLKVLRNYIGRQACDGIDSALNNATDELLGNLTAHWKEKLSHPPAAPTPLPLSGHASDYVDFAANPGVQLVEQLTRQALGNASSKYSLDSLMTRFFGPTGLVNASAYLPVSMAVDLPALASINATLMRLTAEGMNTWSRLEVEAPQAQSVGMGFLLGNLTIRAELRLNVTLARKGPLQGSSLAETFNVQLGLQGLGLNGTGFMALNKTYLGTLSTDQLPGAGCFAPGVIQALSTSAGFQLLQPELQVFPLETHGLEFDVDHMINLAVAALLGSYFKELEAIGNYTVAVNGTYSLNGLVKQQLLQMSTEACPAPENNYTNPALASIVGVIAIVIFTLSFAAYMLCRKRASARSYIETPRRASTAGPSCAEPPSAELNPQAVSPAPATPVAADKSSGVASAEVPATAASERGECTQVAGADRGPDTFFIGDVSIVDSLDCCLARHPRTNPRLKWSLPLLVVGNMLLFMSSNSGAGTSVMISIKANGQDVISLPSLKDFSLIGTVKDMVNAKVWGLAFLVLGFSGIWPYTKLLAMIVCWLSPPRILSVRNRQRVLSCLDAFGKWSMIDCFVMVLFMVAFKFDISVLDNAPSEFVEMFQQLDANASLRVYVQPLLSFHLFLIATLLSLILGHIMSDVNRHVAEVTHDPVQETCNDLKRPLCDVLREGGTWAWRFGPPAALLSSLVLTCVGINIATFQFTFQGLSGLALGPEGSKRPFSIVSLAKSVPDSNPNPGDFGILWIQFVFFVFAIVMVIAYPLVLIVLWLVPLKKSHQRNLVFGIGILDAWSALDVFMISIVAGVFEIRRFALFIIGDKCDGLDKLLEHTPIKKLVPGPLTCFDVNSELRSGYWILFAAVVLATIVGRSVSTKCANAFQ